MLEFIATTEKNKQSYLLYYQTEGDTLSCKLAISHNGLEFLPYNKDITIMDHQHHEDKNYNWKNCRISKHDKEFILTYKLTANAFPHIYGAKSTDLLHWEKIGKIDDIEETATLVPQHKHNDQYIMYYGEKDIKVAYAADLQHWQEDDKPVLTPRPHHFDDTALLVGNAFDRDKHILLTYYSKKEKGKFVHYNAAAVLFDKKNPSTPVWRSEEPLWQFPPTLQHAKIQPLGSVILNNHLILYWLVNDTNIYAVTCSIPSIQTGFKNKVFSHLVKKFKNNPILAPRQHMPWESRATFNSAAIYEDGKVHFLYRALGDKDLSVLGYATSRDGLTIDERSEEPIYIPREPFETPGGNAFTSFADHFASGGGYGGIEDPRITRVEDRLYLTYVAYDGATPPRAAMSSIHIDDFLSKNWDQWAKPKLISAPGMVNKSAVIFPRKVNGKYVVLHRVYPNILVDFLDDLEFNDYLKGHYSIPPRRGFWDSKKVGAGAPPMETKDGWLLVYQSVGYQDPGRYKIGAMMLDRDNPTKVLYRTPTPIIEPVEHYENNGHKAGVVYPCGAVIMDNKLHIYYGGADTVVCAASTDLDHFLDQMKHHQSPHLHATTLNN